jgi:uncharacterized coiled-coil DUF342 family protein
MRNLLSLTILIGLVACQQTIADQISDTKNELMNVHDEVMPLMDPLYSLRKDLGEKADSMLSEGQDISVIQETIRQIEMAEQSMMTWMHMYEPHFSGESDSITLRYFQAQNEAITEVGEEMNEAVSAGEALLK